MRCSLRRLLSLVILPLCLFCATVFASAADFVYRRPIPELPKVQDPSLVNDYFTFSLLYQIHAALFKFDQNRRPEPHLVTSVQVAPNQLMYEMELKKVKFHNDQSVTATDVKVCIENAIRNKVVNFEGFNTIQGFAQFVAGHTKQLSGIRVLGPLKFKITLSKPDPQLLEKLADIRFAIWNMSDRSGKIGVGPYRFKSRGNGHVYLERFDQSDSDPAISNEPQKIDYIEVKQSDQAFNLYKKGEVDDLFFYTISDHLASDLRGTSHIQQIYFPRTYYFAVNARNLSSRSDREYILNSVNKVKLIGQCFPTNKTTADLVPAGFLGHYNAVDQPIKKISAKSSKLAKARFKVAIVASIGQEECLMNEITSQLSGVTDVQVKIESLSTAVDQWLGSKIDGIVAYMEGESTVHYFGSFNPQAEFPLGDPKDTQYNSYYSKFVQEMDPILKQQAGESLAKHVLERQTFLPLFHPKVYLIYQNYFARLATPFQSPAMIPLTEMRKAKSLLR